MQARTAHAEDVVGEPGTGFSWAETHPEFSLLYHIRSFSRCSGSAHTGRAGDGLGGCPPHLFLSRTVMVRGARSSATLSL